VGKGVNLALERGLIGCFGGQLIEKRGKPLGTRFRKKRKIHVWSLGWSVGELRRRGKKSDVHQTGHHALMICCKEGWSRPPKLSRAVRHLTGKNAPHTATPTNLGGYRQDCVLLNDGVIHPTQPGERRRIGGRTRTVVASTGSSRPNQKEHRGGGEHHRARTLEPGFLPEVCRTKK